MHKSGRDSNKQCERTDLYNRHLSLRGLINRRHGISHIQRVCGPQRHYDETSKVSGSSYATGAEQISVGSSGASNAAIGDGTNARVVPYVLYKGIKFSATGNVTSYTDLLSSPTSSAGSLTLVANQLLVGSVIHGKLAATVTVGTAGNLNFEVKLGGTVINSPVTLNTPPASTTVFTLEFWAFVTATGTSGSVTTSSDGHTGGTATSFIQIDQDGSTATVNTTGTLAIDVVGEFGTSNASNTMQVMFAEMDLY